MLKRVATLLLLMTGLLHSACSGQAGKEKVTKMPSFTLKDQDGNVFRSDDHAGKHKLVIFFYPKDESPVCTKEACSFRDNYKAFTDAGAIVIGINSGSVASHKSFQQKQHLPYILLSDPGNKVLKAFGVKNALFLTGRETFIIDHSGTVVFNFRDMMSGGAHARRALEALEKAR